MICRLRSGAVLWSDLGVHCCPDPCFELLDIRSLDSVILSLVCNIFSAIFVI